jgi:hypothetical protein
MNKRNPTHKGNILRTQLGDSEMECSSRLSGIGSKTVCRGRSGLFKKVFVERIRYLRTIRISNGPENNQNAVPDANADNQYR